MVHESWIKWRKNRKTIFLGRNGTFKCIGVVIWRSVDRERIIIEPITSKNKFGRCTIVIPGKDLKRVIKRLKSIQKTLKYDDSNDEMRSYR